MGARIAHVCERVGECVRVCTLCILVTKSQGFLFLFRVCVLGGGGCICGITMIQQPPPTPYLPILGLGVGWLAEARSGPRRGWFARSGGCSQHTPFPCGWGRRRRTLYHSNAAFAYLRIMWVMWLLCG